MFSTAILDSHTKLSADQKRFYGCIRLVADSTISAVFYINSDWSKRCLREEIGLEELDILHLLEKRSIQDSSDLRDHLEKLLPEKDAKGDEPRLICLKDGSWELPSNNEGKRPVELIGDKFILSPSKIINQAALLDQGFNGNSAILCLAAVGIDIILPNIAVDLLAESEILEIRDKFEEERVEYINAVTALSQNAFTSCVSGDFEDVFRWAKNEATFAIAPKARSYEVAVAKHTKKVLANAGFSLWKNGVPAIGAAYLSGGLVPAASVAGAQMLQTFVQATIKNKPNEMLPEVTYAMKIKADLS